MLCLRAGSSAMLAAQRLERLAISPSKTAGLLVDAR